MTWREYHEATKHTRQSLQRSRHVLDWENMPDPFRHYEGVPLLDLPAIATPAIAQPLARIPAPADGATFLSQLLFHSAAVSASKRVAATGYRYALRVNPSSGNLHPTEFHFFANGLSEWPDGLYHYRASSHMAEQRALGHPSIVESSAPVVFLLTSIAWREAWKYQDRAYRYCLLDIGHAWEALALSARALGCTTFARGSFGDDRLAQDCGLSDDEWPMLLIELDSGALPLRPRDPGEPIWFGGAPNPLSSDPLPFPRIERMHEATKALSSCPGTDAAITHASANGPFVELPAPARSTLTFEEAARARRSALDFIGGDRSISLAQLSALLTAASQPLSADFARASFIGLYLYVHRVNGLAPGVYHFVPQRAGLERIREGDQRVAAAGLSLGQDLAGNACVAFSMIADLEHATSLYGDRGYRYAHFEAGAIGQRLYLAAEALGLRATGIGAFFDDEVHQYLNVSPQQGQVIYHFAIGYPVADPRLDS